MRRASERTTLGPARTATYRKQPYHHAAWRRHTFSRPPCNLTDTVVARSKAINYLHLVAAVVERHDGNSGRRPVESSLFPFYLKNTYGPMTSAMALSASELADVRPVSYDVRVVVRVCPMTILRYANSSWADGLGRSDGRIRIAARPQRIWRNRHVTSVECLSSAQAQRSTNSLPYWGLEFVPGLTPKQCRIYIRTNACGILSSHRQNVVLVGAVGITDPLVTLLRLRYYIYWICCTICRSSAVTIYKLYNFIRRVPCGVSHRQLPLS